jgi:hypothetical protein
MLSLAGHASVVVFEEEPEVVGLYPIEFQLLDGTKLEKKPPRDFVGAPGVRILDSALKNIEERLLNLFPFACEVPNQADFDRYGFGKLSSIINGHF